MAGSGRKKGKQRGGDDKRTKGDSTEEERNNNHQMGEIKREEKPEKPGPLEPCLPC